MNSDRKRKLGESENEQFIMTLLKRLHLEKSSELFEKVPLSSKPPPSSPLSPGTHTGNKRWRLSTIMEEDQDPGAAKRRRIDTEMADNLFHNLWISDNSKEEEKIPISSAEEASETAAAGAEEPPSFTIVGVRNGGLSLEEEFLTRKLREQQLQLVLWTPPLTVDTIVQNSQHPPRPGDSFKNEEGDSEYMC